MANGEVLLKPTVGAEFSGTTLPPAGSAMVVQFQSVGEHLPSTVVTLVRILPIPPGILSKRSPHSVEPHSNMSALASM